MIDDWRADGDIRQQGQHVTWTDSNSATGQDILHSDVAIASINVGTFAFGQGS